MRARPFTLAAALTTLLATTGAVAMPAPSSSRQAGAPDDPAAERARLEAAVAGAPTEAGPRLLLGDFLARTGDVDGALATFRQAAERAHAADDLAAAHLAVAILERQRGNADEALRRYQLALEAAPAEPLALDGAATLLSQLGRYREAVPYFGRLIAADRSNRQAWTGGAGALILAGEHARAKIVLEQAVAAFPDDLTLLDLLARHLAACPDTAVRDGKRAVEVARRLVDEVPTAESHETLAMALAQDGAFDRAVSEQQELIRRFAATSDPATAERWRANLERYRSGRACCAGE